MLKRSLENLPSWAQLGMRKTHDPALATALVSVLAIGVLIVWFRLDGFADAAALYGYSPTILTGAYGGNPALWTGYPGGEQELLKSIVMHAYPILSAIGLSKATILTLMVLLEYFSMIGAIVFATQRLSSTQALPIALTVALFFCTGKLLEPDLARWGYPFFGYNYVFAYAGGITATSFLLTKSYIPGGLVLGLTVAMHPVIGLLFGLFVAAAILVRLRDYKLMGLVLAASLSVTFAGTWLFFATSGAGISGTSIPGELFTSITRMMSYHFFPVYLGVFSTMSYEGFSPFVGFLVLIAIYMTPSDHSPLRWQLLAGMGAMLVLTATGAIMADVVGSPFFIKLALHRSSMLILLFGAIFIVPGLLKDLFHAHWWRGAFCALLLITPFFCNYGIPAFLCIAYGLGILIERHISGQHIRQQWLLISAIGAAIAVHVFLLANGYMSFHGAGFEHLVGVNKLLAPLAGITIALLLIARVSSSNALGIFAIGLAAAVWVPNTKLFSSEEAQAKASDYREVQLWARAHTPQDAFFMPDPGHAYGWREFSHRASFGTVREWLYTGWTYNTRGEPFNEGIARFEALGLSLEDYLEYDQKHRGRAKDKMLADAREKYYSAETSWFAKISTQYGVDYFVFEKDRLYNPPPLSISYQNENYLVGQAPAQ